MTTVLIIEDEYQIRSNIAEILAYEGFATLEAENGRIGVEKAKNYLPDLILCDIMMPELDGYSVLLQLRDDPPTAMIPFIFLTARTEQASMRQGMRFGADDYLTKPFMPDELLAAVKTRLERQAVILREKERHIEELRVNLLHTLPHELRTPLTAVIGYSDYILMFGDDLDHTKIAELATSINRAGYRLLRMIENYLIYAQIEIAQSDPERVQAIRQGVTKHPGEVITTIAMGKAAENARKADLILATENVPISISETYFEKIVSELLDNAFKFSGKQTPVFVNAAVDRTKNAYVLQLKDQGIGMTPEQTRTIGAYMQFERKLHEQQGAGLGLIIAKRLVELHQGHFAIDSTYGQQTCVIVHLPLKQSSEVKP